MFDIDAVPSFFFKMIPDQDGWFIRNPLTENEHKLNRDAYWLLRLCDGKRTWNEIVEQLSQAYQTSNSQIAELSGPLVRQLFEEGLLWWRHQRMRRWRLPPPAAVLWDLTAKCNLRCRHCVVSADSSKSGELSLDECHKLVDDLAAFGVQQLILSGGEPLMRRDFFEIATHAASQGLHLQLATNATLVTKQIATRLTAIRGVDAQVSLDGATPEVHDDFRQVPGTWERTVRGIRNLVKTGVPVMVAAVVTKANIDQIPALYALAADLGAHTFRILPFVPFGRGGTARELEVSPEEMRDVTAYLYQRRNEGGLPVAPMEFECTFGPPPAKSADQQARIGCDGAAGYCAVTADGEVLPCNFFAGVEAENVRENNFAWIWEHSDFLNYFRSLTISDIDGACQECSWLPNCKGSCIAANFAHGDIFQSNCHCWVAQA